MRNAMVLLVLVGVGCGKSGDSPGSAEAPTPVVAPVSDAAATDAAAADATSTASPAGDWLDAGPIAVTTGGRSLTLRRPLRGVSAADAPVFVARDADPAVAIRRALDSVKPPVPTDRPVVLLVNIGGFDRLKRKGPDDGITGRITDRGFVRALIAELRRRGVTDLAVAGGASKPEKEMQRLLVASGYGAMLDELGAPYINLNHYGDGDSQPAPWKLAMPWATHLQNELVLADPLINPERRIYLIDIPKLKAHRFAVMTLSIKNLMGAVMIDDAGRSTAPWQRRWRMHRELSPWLKQWKKSKTDDRKTYRAALATFSERLADLYGALTPDLVLLEGYPAMQGDGFARVVPYGDGPILIASTNGCYADYVAAEFFGLHDSDALEAELGARMPPATAAVAERYYGGVDRLRKVVVRGDVDWRGNPAQAWFKAMAPFEIGARP